MNIIFMGTPDFARDSLKAIYEKGHNILAVLTKEDKPQGRGMKISCTPVKEYAIEKEIPVYQPTKIRNNNEIIDLIQKLNPDLICVVAYGKILPKEILEIPRSGCVNVHASLLPKYRGAAPIQWAVINGDKTTGVTTMYMDENMDTGDMILKREVEISDNETTGELWNRLSTVGAELLVETIEKIQNGTANREKQPEKYTLAPMINKELSKIDWETKTAYEIKNLTRGLNPIMGTYCFNNGKKIKFWQVDVISEKELINLFSELEEYSERLRNVQNGTVLFSDSKNGLYIKANDGIIKVLEIQGENSRKMSISDFLRGNVIEIGSIMK